MQIIYKLKRNRVKRAKLQENTAQIPQPETFTLRSNNNAQFVNKRTKKIVSNHNQLESEN